MKRTLDPWMIDEDRRLKLECDRQHEKAFVVCQECGGEKYIWDESPGVAHGRKCPVCHGSGEVRRK